ncbi:hypothetical protein SY86_16595 [Erwinia tracheiphila]|uniref:Transposase n=1 Tax=Erwinia tracheiphila TaxID=65700 RepID=A0A0M2KCL3_9GAMM|nr:ISYps1 transposase [Erwinia tracheiphila PSU-1]KKF36689.1 hypothetical protein SY86_16595 [Erwinia tracheiphila]
MAERGIVVDHSTLHRWVIRLLALLDKAFRRHRHPAGRRWRMDETYIKVKRHGNICTVQSVLRARPSISC